MDLIGFERKRKFHDPHIAPIGGTRGPCVLCKSYSDLTVSHTPPKSVGNDRDLLGNSYLASASLEGAGLLKRRFKNGISFRTLCGDCNSRLGGCEDKILEKFFDDARKILSSNVIFPSPITRITTKPNLLIRGILAHVATSNDSGMRTTFSDDVSDLFFRKTSLRDCPWNVFFWPYTGNSQTIIRDLGMVDFISHGTEVVQVLKLAPLGFVMTSNLRFRGLVRLNAWITNHDEEEREVPYILSHGESHPHWPALPGNTGAAIFSSKSTSVIASPV
jgi:hypothetical protein